MTYRQLIDEILTDAKENPRLLDSEIIIFRGAHSITLYDNEGNYITNI
jgi:hypothetical protein